MGVNTKQPAVAAQQGVVVAMRVRLLHGMARSCERKAAYLLTHGNEQEAALWTVLADDFWALAIYDDEHLHRAVQGVQQ